MSKTGSSCVYVGSSYSAHSILTLFSGTVIGVLVIIIDGLSRTRGFARVSGEAREE